MAEYSNLTSSEELAVGDVITHTDNTIVDTKESKIKYYINSEFKDVEAYYYTNSQFVKVEPSIYKEGVW